LTSRAAVKEDARLVYNERFGEKSGVTQAEDELTVFRSLLIDLFLNLEKLFGRDLAETWELR
jgi:hypothetical protein